MSFWSTISKNHQARTIIIICRGGFFSKITYNPTQIFSVIFLNGQSSEVGIRPWSKNSFSSSLTINNLMRIKDYINSTILWLETENFEEDMESEENTVSTNRRLKALRIFLIIAYFYLVFHLADISMGRHPVFMFLFGANYAYQEWGELHFVTCFGSM